MNYEQDMRAVMDKKERIRERELAKIQQKKRLDKLKEQVCTHVHVHVHVYVFNAVYNPNVNVSLRC